MLLLFYIGMSDTSDADENISDSGTNEENLDENIVSTENQSLPSSSINSNIATPNRGEWSTSTFRSYLHSFYQSAFNLTNKYEKPTKNWKKMIRNMIVCNPRKYFYNKFPVMKWLIRYNWRADLVFDLLAGFTVAVMHITQGMAYSMLGNVDPVVGIYMAFYPVMVYAIFGTSRHISIGTFAVITLMSGSAVDKYSNARLLLNGTVVKSGDPPYYTQVDVTTTVSLITSFFLISMHILRLGVVANLFSDTMVNAFTCACAVKVVTVQIKDILGLHVPKRNEFFSVPLQLYDCAINSPYSNVTTIIISLTVIIVMITYNQALRPLLARRTKIPFPLELCMLVIGTCVSYFSSLHTRHGVKVIGVVPQGLPPFTIPTMSLLRLVFFDGLIIAITSYAVTVSMALIYATKGNYKIDGNQELLALGLCDLIGTFFYCMPISASLSRTHIQYSLGGKTQITSLVSCAILVVVLLWIGSLLESLPRCVLASIIVVSMKGLLVQCLSFPYFWKLCKWDGTLWLVTFLTTALVSIDVGLAAGLLFATFSILYRSQHAYTCALGAVPNTEFYLDMNCYKSAHDIPEIKVFHFSGVINFSTKAFFTKQLYKSVGFNPKDRLARKHSTDFKFIVLDCTSVTYVDPAGVQQLRRIARETALSNITFLIAGCSVPVYETLKKCDALQKNEMPFQIFFSVNSAVIYATEVLSRKNESEVHFEI